MMNTLQEQCASVTRGNTVVYVGTQGTPPDALTSRGLDDEALWRDALEAMLSWRFDPEQFDPDDRPDLSILDTAIDYAVDNRRRGGAIAPSSIVPSGTGRVAFEWRSGNETVVVEFVGLGEAILAHFVGDRVVEKQKLTRNPQTRKLELEG